jgi:hypothetical protein
MGSGTIKLKDLAVSPVVTETGERMVLIAKSAARRNPPSAGEGRHAATASPGAKNVQLST